MEAYTQFNNLIFPERVKISCSFCGSSKSTVKDTLDEWTIVRCECGFCYTNPRPPEDKLHLFYQEEYFSDERHAGKFYEKDGSFKIPPLNMNDARIADIENWFSQRGKLLDVGAARGYFLRTMQARGWKVKGVEISDNAVDFARQNFKIDMFCGTLEEFPDDQTFDVVCMYQTLEHVPDPKYVIDRSFSLLNPGGIIVIEVPNIESHDIKKDPERKRLSYDLPRHLNHFSPSVLHRELNRSGFQVIHTDRYFPQFIINYNDRKLKVKGKEISQAMDSDESVHSINYPMKRHSTNWKLRLLRSVSHLYPGWRFTIIGKKPS